MGFLWSVKHPKRESQPAEWYNIIVYPLWYNAGDVLGKPTAFYGYLYPQLIHEGLATAEPEVQTSACVVIRKSSTVRSLGMIIVWYSS